MLFLLGMARIAIERRKILCKQTTELFKLIGCFLIPAIISLPSSANFTATLEGIGSLFASAIIGLAILNGFGNDKLRKSQQGVISCLLAIWSLIAIVYAIYSTIAHGSILVQPAGSLLSFITSSRLGRLMTALIPMALWGSIRERKPQGFALLIAAGIAIAATGQRNNLLGYLIGALLLATQVPKKVALQMVSAALASLLIIIPFSSELQIRAKHIVEGVLPSSTASLVTPKNLTTLEKINLITNDRGFIYDASISMFKSNPLSGSGAFAFKEAYPKFANKNDSRIFTKPPGPHQIYLGILSQTGLIGILGLAVAICLLYGYWNACKTSSFMARQAAPYAASLVVMLFPLITQEDFYSGYFASLFLYMSCGLISAAFSIRNSSYEQQEGC